MNKTKFLIIPETGLVIAKFGLNISHEQILKNLNISKEQIEHIIIKYPRGYYMDNTIVLYQGNDLTPGMKLELRPESYIIIKDFYSDLKKIFSLNTRTRFYGGLLVGTPGTTWQNINQFKINEILNNKTKRHEH